MSKHPMGDYRYTAVDDHGVAYTKSISAASLLDAAHQLRSAEIIPVGIEQVSVAPRRYEPSGERPAPAPRNIDIGLNATPGGRVLVIVGALFTVMAAVFIGVGITMLSAGEGTGVFFVLFPSIHLVVGLGLLAFAFASRAKRRRIYRSGDVAMATIEGVGFNRSVRVNGENPYEIVWAFDVASHRYHDKRSTFDDRALTFAPGDRLWVLYDPADPEQSVEWPPL